MGGSSGSEATNGCAFDSRKEWTTEKAGEGYKMETPDGDGKEAKQEATRDGAHNSPLQQIQDLMALSAKKSSSLRVYVQRTPEKRHFTDPSEVGKTTEGREAKAAEVAGIFRLLNVDRIDLPPSPVVLPLFVSQLVAQSVLVRRFSSALLVRCPEKGVVDRTILPPGDLSLLTDFSCRAVSCVCAVHQASCAARLLRHACSEISTVKKRFAPCPP
uniref:Uncharacterized protein n=1 Tax=Toxoplasma gondii (strain ATCC 50861 / VEG) TaxID=432359 RepID=A0A0F7V5K2_TOXGV|nr:TPA: hypothetical protein BN1205_084100 [Toxoplasma gondii VEG]